MKRRLSSPQRDFKRVAAEEAIKDDDQHAQPTAKVCIGPAVTTEPPPPAQDATTSKPKLSAETEVASDTQPSTPTKPTENPAEPVLTTEPVDAASDKPEDSKPTSPSKSEPKQASNESKPLETEEKAETSEKSADNAPPSEPKEPKDSKEPKEPAVKPAQKEDTKEDSSAKPTGFASFANFSSFSSFSSFSAVPKGTPWGKPSKPVTSEEQPKPEAKEDAKSSPFSEQKDVKTGEEDEETVFSTRAKLYVIDLEGEKVWKERGCGVVKVNKSTQGSKTKYRLLMRADGVLTVALNLPLVKNTQVFKGFQNTMNPEKFLRIAGVEQGRAHQFALRFGSEENRNNLNDEIESCLQSHDEGDD